MLSLMVEVPLQEMVTALRNGHRLWGGGAGVERVPDPNVVAILGPAAASQVNKILEMSEVYEVTGAGEEGVDECYRKVHRNVTDAVWDFLRKACSGGGAMITVEVKK